MILRYKSAIDAASAKLTEKFTSSLDFDRRMLRHIVAVELWHVKTLASRGLIPNSIAKKIAEELKDIVMTKGEALYKWIEGSGVVFEDLFEALEAYLIDRIGPESGHLALGRSRNDHISATLRLWLMEELINILNEILELRSALLEKASEYKDTIIPFFTHQQVAQCGSAALYFVSHERSFADLWDLLAFSAWFLKENPLGSGASAGTWVNILGNGSHPSICFSDEVPPPYFATGSRLFLLNLLHNLSLVAAEASRMANDFIMIASTFPDLLEPPMHHIATSSIMPHKRNLVTMEVVRARASEVLGLVHASAEIYRSIPYGYNLDLQEINRLTARVIDSVVEILKIVKDFVQHIKLKDISEKLLTETFCWSSDVVEMLAAESGVPARIVHIRVGRTISESRERPFEALARLGLSLGDVKKILKEKPVELMKKKLIEDGWRKLSAHRLALKSIESELDTCFRQLLESELNGEGAEHIRA